MAGSSKKTGKKRRRQTSISSVLRPKPMLNPGTVPTFFSSFFSFSFFHFYNCIVSLGYIPWEIRVVFPGESQLRQSRATQPAVHSVCISVSIIHWTLTWATGSWTCAQMLMHAIAHRGVRTHVGEPTLNVDFGRKVPCCTRDSTLRQRRAGPMLYQQSYIPTRDGDVAQFCQLHIVSVFNLKESEYKRSKQNVTGSFRKQTNKETNNPAI